MVIISDDRLQSLLDEASAAQAVGKIEVPVFTLRSLISEVLVRRAENRAATARGAERVDPFELPTGSD